MDMYMEGVHGECTWFKHYVHPWGGLVKVFKNVQVYMEVDMVFGHG